MNTPLCSCTTYSDIRARCNSGRIRSNKQWKHCRARLDTSLWSMGNDRDTLMQVQELMGDKTVFTKKETISINAIMRVFLLRKMRLTRRDASIVIEMFWEEFRENGDDEVDGIIPLEERSATYEKKLYRETQIEL